MNNTQTSEFIDNLNEIKDLYVEVKEAIILAENFDTSAEVYLSPLNELRNSLDHIMRSIVYPEKMGNELDEAKEHLYRAGYDAYEVMAINVATNIVNIIEDFDAEIISVVFPTYFTEIKPNLIDIKVELADTRAHKRLNPVSGTKSFTPYKEKMSNLIRQLKSCNEQIPALRALRKKRKRKGWVNIAFAILLTVVGGALGTLVYESYLKSEKAASAKPLIQDTIKKPNTPDTAAKK
jgi:hypothetical protein